MFVQFDVRKGALIQIWCKLWVSISNTVGEIQVLLEKILNIKWQQKIKNKDIMTGTGTDIHIMQRMIERKMNFFGHIHRMQDEGLIKKSSSELWMAKIREEDLKEGGLAT